MKTVLWVTGAVLAASSCAAFADHTHISVGVGIGPAYYEPAPVYAPPAYYYPDPPAVEQAPALAPPPQTWYYCDQARAYYPYVMNCAGPWRAVAASAAPAPAAPSRATYALGAALFAGDPDHLQPQADSILHGLLDEARRCAACRITVEGQATGGDAAALALAQRRAEAVRRYLLNNGVAAGQVVAVARAAKASAPVVAQGGVSVTISEG